MGAGIVEHRSFQLIVTTADGHEDCDARCLRPAGSFGLKGSADAWLVGWIREGEIVNHASEATGIVDGRGGGDSSD